MKKEEWNEGLNNIDSDLVKKYVEEKDKLTVKKKRKNVLVRSVSAVACLCIVVGAFAGVCAKKQVSYTIYTESSLGEYDYLASDVKENVSFGRLNERDFNFVTETEVTNNKAPSKKELNIDQNNFSMALKKSYTTAISKCENEKLACIGKIDRYETADRGVEAHFRQDTGELVFFLNYNLEKNTDTLTDEETKELADKLFISLYGEDKLKEYTYTRISNDNTENSVTYFRYVHGYETNDTISIKFNKQGELYSLNANRMGTFEDAEKSISKSEIEKAVKVLTDTLGDVWTQSYQYLTIDSTGTYFVVVGALNGDYVKQFYININ